MAFIPATNVAEFRMQFLWDGQYCENVFHVLRGAGWDSGSLVNIASAFKGWWDTYLKTLVPGTVSLQRVLGKDLTTDGSVAVEYTSGLPLAGTGGSPALPNNVSVAIKWGTGLAGRSYRGRSFHIGLMESQVTDNRIATTHQVALASAYDNLRMALDVGTLGVDFGVLSRYHNNAPRTSGVLTPILGISVDPVIDSMKRRLPGRGR